MKKTMLTYGLISGGLIAPIMYLLLCLARNHEHFVVSGILMYSALAMLFVMMFWGIKTFRDHTRHGVITFGRAFQAGMLISLATSLSYSVIWVLLYTPLFKGFMEQHAAALIENIKTSGVPALEMAAKKDEIVKHNELYSNPLLRAALIFIQGFPVEAIMAAIVSFLLMKKQPGIA